MIKQIHKAPLSSIADLKTYTVLPTSSLQQIDPFIFLNHHGPQIYPPDNNGLPFGPHPHRGMETVTFIIDGDIVHKDSGGHESKITAGGVQWMTAGKGLIHAEISSEEFKKVGGNLEILQLWINLPAKHKMTEPYYKGWQANEIPAFHSEDKSTEIKLISGEWQGHKGVHNSISEVQLALIKTEKDAEFTIHIPEGHNIFFYIISGELKIGNQNLQQINLVEFETSTTRIHYTTTQESLILFGHTKAFNEPLVTQGPFVMNTQEEIMQAYADYREGKFGTWEF